MVNSLFSIKYLYQYFMGEIFRFDEEDRLLELNHCHEQWTEIYKGISLCQSYSCFNIVALNVGNSIKHWSNVNPFGLKFSSKGLTKFVETFRQFFEEKKKRYS